MLAAVTKHGAELQLQAATLPGATFIALGAAVGFAELVQRERQRVVAELTTRYTLERLIDVACAVDLLDFDRPSFHDRLQRAQVNAASRPLQMVNGVFAFLAACFASIGIMMALFVVAPLALAMILLAFVPAWIAGRLISRSIYDFTAKLTANDRQRLYLFSLLTTKQHATELRSFGFGGLVRRRYDALYTERINEVRSHARDRLRFGLVGATIASALTGVTLTALLFMVSSGRLEVAQAGAAALAVTMLRSRFSNLSASTSTLYEGSLFLEDFTDFIDVLPSLEASRPAAPAPEHHRRILLDRVSFVYPSRATPSLDGVTIELRVGEIVAIVGENGSGKTTLAKIVAGLLQPSSGAVYWDQTDLATVDPLAVRERIAVLFQDFGRYHMTARDNIALGRESASEDTPRVHSAATAAGMGGFLADLPDGLESRLGPEFLGGTDLSVGQWQRLAMARAFFRDADIVVLDEPTASLDAQAEADTFHRMQHLCAGRTVLLISHRLSSVRHADHIYVLHEGKVIEKGTHEELMHCRGHYAELFATQASAYVDLAG